MNKYIIVITMILLFIGTAFAAFPDTTNLKGYWDLNELSGNPVDKSGNGVVGTSTNIVYGGTGKIDTDFGFWDGAIYGNVDFNNSTYFMPAQFSWAFWAKKDITSATNYFFITRDNGTATGISYQMGFYNTTTNFTMGNTAGTGFTVNGGTQALGDWNFYVFSFDGSNMYLWIDNVLQAPTAFTGTPVTSAINTRFGTRSNGYTGLKGSLDEVSFWDKNLSSTDVNDLWNSGYGITPWNDPAPTPPAPDVNTSSTLNIGQTTINTFTTYGNFIAGIGNAVSGAIDINYDTNFGSKFVQIISDSNDYRDVATDPTGQKVFVTTNDGKIIYSPDAGDNWSIVNNSNRERFGIAMSDTNNIVVSASYGGKIDISYDGGTTWVQKDSNLAWHDVAISETGQYILAITSGQGQFLSSDWGANFVNTGLPSGAYSAAMTSNGKEMIVGGGLSGYIWKSADYGTTWTQSNTILGGWLGASYAKYGNYAYITKYLSNKGYYTDNNGASWTELVSLPDASQNIGTSYDGATSIFTVSGNEIYVSTNYGATVVPFAYTGSFTAAAFSNSSNTYIVSSDGYIYKQASPTPGINEDSCQYTDNNGSSWSTASYNTDTLKCEKLNITVALDTSYIFNFRAQDNNGVYAYGIPTPAYLGAEGSVIQFIVKNESGASLENVDLNFYKVDLAGDSTFYTTLSTDSTGSAYAVLQAGTTYLIDIFYNGELIGTNKELISTQTPIYITINQTTGQLILPDIQNINVAWNPSIDYIYSDVTSLKQSVTSSNVVDFNLTIYYKLDNDRNVIYTVAGACLNNCNLSTALALLDLQLGVPFFVDINLGIDSGYRYVTTHKYVTPDTSTGPATMDLIRLARADFACSVDPADPCGPTILIAIILAIAITGGIVISTGYNGPSGIAVMILGLLAIFTYVGWMYWMVFFLIGVPLVLFAGRGVSE